MGKIKALIIDDEIDICVLLAAALKEKGLKTSFTLNLTDGFKKISLDTPYLLFLDINLPDGSGIDALKEIKKTHPGIHIIMISAYDEEAEKKAAIEYGAMDFISKPFNKKRIFKTIETLL